MASPLVSLALSGLGRDALRVALGLALAVLVALAFAAATLAAVLGTVASAFGEAAGLIRVESADGPGETRTPLSGPAADLDANVVGVARRQIGTPYVWGGADPRGGFDCSGLVQWTYRAAGVALPRTAQLQYEATTPVARDRLRPGDLVFFQICCQPPDVVTHVGIYVGTGQMLHAPAAGEYVRMESIDTPYWGAHYAGAGRVAVASRGARAEGVG